MTKNLILGVALIIALAACTLGGGNTPPPNSIDIVGAAGLYLQSGGGSKSITAPDGAILMKLLGDATTGEATFEDAEGKPVTVTILKTLQLTTDYLLLSFSYADGQVTAIVTLATGELRSLPVPPDDWERIRMHGSTAYYVSGGAIHRVELDTLMASDLSQGDRISGSSLIFLDAELNIHTFNLVVGSVSPANQIRIYFADGSPFDVLGWGTPQGVLFCEWYGAGSAIEDQESGRVYHVFSAVGGFQFEEITFDETGVYLQPRQILDAAQLGMHYRLAPSTAKAYLKDVAFYSGDAVAMLNIDAAGSIASATVRAFDCYNQPSTVVSGKVYTASPTGIDTLDVASGAIEQPVADTGITALEVVGDQVFYAKDTGTWKYDPVADTTELVSADPAEILAVTR